MNDNILNDLFYGKIDPWEEHPTNIEEFRQLNQKMGQLSDVLESRLDDDTKELKALRELWEEKLKEEGMLFYHK